MSTISDRKRSIRRSLNIQRCYWIWFIHPMFTLNNNVGHTLIFLCFFSRQGWTGSETTCSVNKFSCIFYFLIWFIFLYWKCLFFLPDLHLLSFRGSNTSRCCAVQKCLKCTTVTVFYVSNSPTTAVLSITLYIVFIIISLFWQKEICIINVPLKETWCPVYIFIGL